METKIIAIQFRRNPETIKQEQASILRSAHGVDVTFLDAIEDTVDWQYPETYLEGCHGVILGGSGELDFDGNRDENDECRKISYELLGKLRPMFTYLFDHDIPTLGICYGHQLLGAFAGAQVVYDEQQKKTSSHQVHVMVDKNDYFLFSDLPESFKAQYGHKDVLDRIPDDAVLLMNGGDECKVSALKYKNNIYTMQFHPELTYADITERIKESPGYLPEGVAMEEIFTETPHASKILENFYKMVVSHKDKVKEAVPA